jgi:hypothetical protein
MIYDGIILWILQKIFILILFKIARKKILIFILNDNKNYLLWYQYSDPPK